MKQNYQHLLQVSTSYVFVFSSQFLNLAGQVSDGLFRGFGSGNVGFLSRSLGRLQCAARSCFAFLGGLAGKHKEKERASGHISVAIYTTIIKNASRNECRKRREKTGVSDSVFQDCKKNIS